jgi:hypothetical protein
LYSVISTSTVDASPPAVAGICSRMRTGSLSLAPIHTWPDAPTPYPGTSAPTTVEPKPAATRYVSTPSTVSCASVLPPDAVSSSFAMPRSGSRIADGS